MRSVLGVERFGMEENMEENQNNGDQQDGAYQNNSYQQDSVYENNSYEQNSDYQNNNYQQGSDYPSNNYQSGNDYQNSNYQGDSYQQGGGYQNSTYQSYGNTYQPYNNVSFYTDGQLDLEEPVKVSEWVWSLLLMFVPCVNIILMFVWAFSASEKKSKSNFFKAYLIITAISFGLMLLAWIGIIVFALALS